MRASARAARARLRRLVGADESAGRLATAWAVGVAISLSPLLGLQTGLALVLAFVFRLNKIDVLLGTLLINPWTLPPYFAAAVSLGAWLTGGGVPDLSLPDPDLLLSASAWREHASWLKPLLLAWFAGAGLTSPVGGVLTYLAVRRAIDNRRRRAARVTPSG